jgi:hypothetical protein
MSPFAPWRLCAFALRGGFKSVEVFHDEAGDISFEIPINRDSLSADDQADDVAENDLSRSPGTQKFLDAQRAVGFVAILPSIHEIPPPIPNPC